jgi:hypothetical protein
LHYEIDNDAASFYRKRKRNVNFAQPPAERRSVVVIIVVLRRVLPGMQDITDKIVNLSAAELVPVVDMDCSSRPPVDRTQTRLHEQIKTAIRILQLERRVIFIANRARKFSTIHCNRCRDSFAPPRRVENRREYLASAMILPVSRQIYRGGLAMTAHRMANRAAGFSGEQDLSVNWISPPAAQTGATLRLALQQTHMSDEGLTIFLAEIVEPRHAPLWYAFVDQIEQRVIRQISHGRGMRDIRRMFTTAGVKAVANRASRFENVFSSGLEFRIRSRRVAHALTKAIAGRSQKQERETNSREKSASHVVSTCPLLPRRTHQRHKKASQQTVI